MVNFMDQLDWALGSPDSWLNIILSVSVRIFLDEIDDESKLLSITWWASSNQLKAWMEQKNSLLLSKRILLHAAFRLHLQQQLFLAQQKTAFRLKLEHWRLISSVC